MYACPFLKFLFFHKRTRGYLYGLTTRFPFYITRMFAWRPTEAFKKKVYVAFLTFRMQVWKGHMKEQDSRVFYDRGHSCGAISFSLLFLFCCVFPLQMIDFPCLNWRAFFLFSFSNFIPNPFAFALLNSWFALFSAGHQLQIRWLPITSVPNPLP